MRVYALFVSCLALASPAAAQTIDWKVDASAYAPRPLPKDADRWTTTYDFGSVDLGRMRLAPSFRVSDPPDPSAPSSLQAPFSKSVDVELKAYLKDHPNVNFVLGYLYRQAHHKEIERQSAFDRSYHLPGPDVDHNLARIGISCKFPLKDCFKR